MDEGEDDILLSDDEIPPPNDWMEDPSMLPARPKSSMDRYKLIFALDVNGHKGHDMFVAALPNQVCIVGLAPSHPLIRRHRAEACMRGQASDKAAVQDAAPSPVAAAAAPADEDGGQPPTKRQRASEEPPRQESAAAAAAAEEEELVNCFPLSRLKRVDFEVGGGKNPAASRAAIKESGRSGKRPSSGGTYLKPGSLLCKIESTQSEW